MPSNCPRFVKMLITDTLTTDYFETILCDVLTAARLLPSGFWLLATLLELLGLLELLSLRCSSPESGLQQDCQQNDHSFHDVLVVTRNVLQVHKIADNSKDQYPDDGV
jgi:hypothetical protein